MKTCEVCQNEYDKTFEIIIQGQHHTFDSFECAIHAMAPRCHKCQCAIIGHGAEKDGVIYCSANCARQEGKTGLADRGASITLSLVTLFGIGQIFYLCMNQVLS